MDTTTSSCPNAAMNAAAINEGSSANPNHDQAIQFFRALYPEPVQDSAAVFFSKAGGRNYPIAFTDHESAVQKALELNAQGDSYVGVCLHRESVLTHGSRKSETVMAFPGLWLDFDLKGVNHKKSNLPTSKEEVLEFLAKLGINATMIVDSGYGLHVYILLKKPFIITSTVDHKRVDALSKAFSAYVLNEAKKEGWDLDNVSDLARVLRVPGTFNHKVPNDLKPVTILHQDDSCRHELEDMEKLVFSVAEAVVQSTRKVGDVDEITDGSRNTTLTSIAGRLNRNGLNEAEILNELLGINAARCKPPLDEDEVGRIAHSVSQYMNGKPLTSGSFELTDLGNARRFVHQHGDKVKYCGKWKKWLVWDGKRWKIDDTGEVERLNKETALSIYKEAANCDDDKLRPLILAHAKKSQSSSQLKASIDVAKTESAVAVSPGDFDRDIYLFNCENGTLNLLTGTLMEHDPKRLITMLSPVIYDAEAKCSLFMSFIERIFAGDEELMSYLQKIMGYTLSGDISEQVFFYFYGLGANGKSVFLEIFRRILGDYGKQSELTTFLNRKNDSVRNDLAALNGSRFVTSPEVDSDRTLCESIIKQITGGEPLSVRFLYGEHFEFSPKFKLFIAANHKLVIKNQDIGLWRRLKMIPFEVTIPENERDNQLLEKLKGEMSGILNWALEGFRLWKLNRLTTPSSVEEATCNYKSEMDIVGDFLESMCTREAGEREKKSVMYEAYVEWCKLIKETPMGMIQFGDSVRKHDVKDKKYSNGHHWIDIKLKTVEDIMSHE